MKTKLEHHILNEINKCEDGLKKERMDRQITLNINQSITIEKDDLDISDKEWKWLTENSGELEERFENRVLSDIYHYEYEERFVKEMIEYVKGPPLEYDGEGFHLKHIYEKPTEEQIKIWNEHFSGTHIKELKDYPGFGDDRTDNVIEQIKELMTIYES